jgi:hypothetical protein
MNSITEEELKHLYYDEELTDREVADMFGVAIGKVTYKRRELDITIRNMIYQEFINKNDELFEKLNSDSKKRLLRRENIDSISKVITHFIFRNGPVENMHVNDQLSEKDMKTLNKYMVNRIAGLLTAIADNNWLQLELLLSYYKLFGGEWDKAEPDMKEINFAMKYALEDRSLQVGLNTKVQNA